MSARTMSAIEALEDAIRTLELVERNAHTAHVVAGGLQRLRLARDAHHEQQMKTERAREQLRDLASQRRKGFRP